MYSTCRGTFSGILSCHLALKTGFTVVIISTIVRVTGVRHTSFIHYICTSMQCKNIKNCILLNLFTTFCKQERRHAHNYYVSPIGL